MRLLPSCGKQQLRKECTMSDENAIFDATAGMTVETGVAVASQLYGKDAATQIAWLAIIPRSEDLQDKFRFLVKVFKRLTNTPDQVSAKAEWWLAETWTRSP
jgi:hypothetical protein